MDRIFLSSECLAKHIYWRSPALRKSLQRFRTGGKFQERVVQRAELRDFLREIGVVAGSLVMAHTSVTNLRLVEPHLKQPKSNFMAAANCVLNDMREMLGPSGTLVMPTNPQYQTEDALRSAAERDAVISYDPLHTPSAVGLINELFRRSRGTIRSLHPYNPLAANGPLAAKLMENNLNENEPLPHGIHSSYYHFSQLNGLIVGIGVTLKKFMTLVHVPEEVRDADWPIKDFFERRRYLIRKDGQDELHTVRQRRPEFGLFCTIRQCFIDLVREGILHQGSVSGLAVDWASAKDVFDYIMHKNRNSHYPYYGVKFMQWSS